MIEDYTFYFVQCVSHRCRDSVFLTMFITQMSMLGDFHYQTEEVYGEGEALVVDAAGYAKVVRHLAAQTFDGGAGDPRLLLRETVREVLLCSGENEFLTDSSASGSTADERERVCVRTAQGHEYRSQCCIVTFSVCH